MKLSNFKLVVLLFLLMCVLQPLSVIAESSNLTNSYYSLDAENISISQEEDKIYAEGKVTFESSGLIIKSGKMVIHLNKDHVSAEDNVVLIAEDQKIKGQQINYNYKDMTGKIYKAESKIDGFNFTGEKINLFNGKEFKAKIDNASFTPCILEDPHYQIKANDIKVYTDEKIVANNVQFWWGDFKLISLPSYVVTYKEDENGNKSLSSASLMPSLGYNTKDGLTAQINYPYQVSPNSHGKINIKTSQQGNKQYDINHKYQYSDKALIYGNYGYEKDIEEKDSEKIVKEEEIFNTGLNYTINDNLQFKNKYEYSIEHENKQEKDKESLVSSGLEYSNLGLSIKTYLSYDYYSENRLEDVSLKYNDLPYNHLVYLERNYINEEIDKRLYKLYTNGNLIDYNFKYKKGYSKDYLPYINFDFPRVYNINSNLGYGKVQKGNTKSTKMRLSLKYNDTYRFNENWNLDFTEQYLHHVYGLDENQQRSSYKGLISNITLNGARQLNNDLKLNGSLGWEKVITEGDYIFSDDKIDKKDILHPGMGLTISTPAPESAYIFKSDGEYNIATEKWDNINLGLTRKLDCYSISLNYEIIDNYFGFEFNIF